MNTPRRICTVLLLVEECLVMLKVGLSKFFPGRKLTGERVKRCVKQTILTPTEIGDMMSCSNLLPDRVPTAQEGRHDLASV